MKLTRFADQTFRSLRSRNFRLFFVGQLVSQAGTWMQSIAIIWVVLQLTNDGVALGLATAAQFLPVLFLGAWGGVVSDRVDRHRFLQFTQAAYLVVSVAFTVLAFTDRMNLPAIYALSSVYGVITALDNPARRALVVEMVDQADVPNAVGLNSALMTGSRVVGPAAAGILISTVGAEWAFLVNSVTFVAIIAALALMDRSALHSPPVVPRAKGQLQEGLRYVWATKELRLTFILLAVVGTLAFEYQVSLPLLAERSLQGGPGTFTLLYSLMSIGSVAGALVVARRSEVRAPFLARAAIGLAVATTLLALAPNRWTAMVAVVPVGFTMVFLLSGSNAVIQLQADPSMRGRVLALTAVVFLGSTPIGGPIVGAVSEHVGARAGVGLGALASGLVGVWTLRQLRRVDTRPSEPVTASHLRPATATATASGLAGLHPPGRA
jgi:MFS family permease